MLMFLCFSNGHSNIHNLSSENNVDDDGDDDDAYLRRFDGQGVYRGQAYARIDRLQASTSRHHCHRHHFGTFVPVA